MVKGSVVCAVCLSKGTQTICTGTAPDEAHKSCSIWKKIDITKTFPTNDELKSNYTPVKGKSLDFDTSDTIQINDS